jgi:glycosyltransferase involved in cell wall biosynthesis
VDKLAEARAFKKFNLSFAISFDLARQFRQHVRGGAFSQAGGCGDHPPPHVTYFIQIRRNKNSFQLGWTGVMGCRLLFLVGQLRSGGLERQLYYLLQSMNRERYAPEVVVWNFCENDMYVRLIRALDIPLHYFPSQFSGATKLRAFRRMIKQINPEVVHSYTFYTNFAAFWATRGTKSIAIGGVRSDFAWAKREAGLLLGRLSARWPRKQIFNNSAAARSAPYSKGPFVPKEYFIVRNGLDLELFSSVPPAQNGQANILGVGSLFPVKRWDRLVLVALALKQKRLDFRIRVVGDGPLKVSLKQQAQAVGVGDCLEFIGHAEADDIPRLISEATFLVHTADKEGCPNAVMEAMACGRAVVATEVGDVPQIVEDGTTGFVVRCGDDTMLMERIETLISNRDLCSAMGKAGRHKAEREFGLDRLVSDTLAVYRSVGWKDF